MKIAPELQERWNQLKREGLPGLTEALSIRITHLDQGKVKASMPVTDAVRQPFGLLHGGASVALAETAASLGSVMLIDPDRERAAGVEINANHLLPVKSGTVHAEATVIHQGKRLHVWEIRITDDRDKLTCICRCTVAVLPA
jgi:1,4-dihydroxy-2-naphthoyl-CoA hydrolase